MGAPMATTGQVIAGRYELVKELGAGGVGIVFRAHDRLAGGDVALKLLKRPKLGPRPQAGVGCDDRGSSLVLRHEFRAMTRLSHPNLVAVRDYGRTDADGGEDYFTMELVEGVDLDKLKSTLSVIEIRWVLGQIARALAFVHSRGFVHRDLKPSNVRLIAATVPGSNRFSRAKVMDLGLLGHAGEQATQIIGTPSYLPPEVIFGGIVDRRSDFYSLGVLAYELCVGKVPHQIGSLRDLYDIDFRAPHDPRARRPDLPDDLARLIVDLLALDANQRPYDAAEIVDRLGLSLDETTQASQPADGVDASYLTTAAVVGRAAELERLRALWDDARAAKSRAAIIRGLAGAGKTRLLREFLVEAKLDGALVLEAVCRDRAEAPFAVLRALVEPLLLQPFAREELYQLEEASLLERLVPSAAELTPRLPAGKEYLDPAFAREQAFQLVTRWLGAVSRTRPVLLSVDDVQWCDAASLDALHAVLSGGADARILFLGTERKEGEGLSRIDLPAEEISIGPLASADVCALLTAMFGVAEPPDALIDHLVRASQGNAYFLIELVRSLQESGQIRRVSGRWELPVRPVVERLPTSLEDAIDRRIERLSPDARKLADAACVLESELSTELIQALFSRPGHLDDDTLFDAIDELVRAELWIGSAGRYQFRHARCRERLYRLLSPAELEQRHLAAAETLAQRADANDRRAAEIGEHFARGPASARERAITYLLRGADLLWDAQAFADLLRPLEQAQLLLGDDDPRLLLALNRLGRACFYSDHHRAVDYFARLRKHYLAVGVFSWLPRLSRNVGRHLALLVVVIASWFACALRGRRKSFAGLTESLLGVFTSSAFLSAALAYTGRLTDALEVGRSLEPLVISKKKLPYAGRMICEFVPRNWQGRYDESSYAIDEALRCFETDQKTPIDPFDRAVATCGALTGLALNELWRGRTDVDAILEKLERAIEKNELFFVRIMYHEAMLCLRITRGQIEEAEKEFADGVALNRRAGHVPLIDGHNRVWLARAYFSVGRLREAYDLAREVMDREAKNRMLYGLASEVSGLVNLAWGRLDRAELQMRRCLAAGQDPAMRSGLLVIRGHIGLGAIEIERRNLPAAVSHLQSAIKLACQKPYLNEIEEAAAQRLVALVAAIRKDAPGARAALARANELAKLVASGVATLDNGRMTARVEAILRGETPGPLIAASVSGGRPDSWDRSGPPPSTPPSDPSDRMALAHPTLPWSNAATVDSAPISVDDTLPAPKDNKRT